MTIANGFDFQPLDDGNVLIEFFGDDGKTFNTQVVTADVMRNMAAVSALTDLAMRKGPEMAGAVMKMLADKEGTSVSFPTTWQRSTKEYHP